MESKWISVEDRLPEVDVKVLVLCEDGDMEVTRRRNQVVETTRSGNPKTWEVLWDYKCCCWAMDSTITHWMPLPDKPKE